MEQEEQAIGDHGPFDVVIVGAGPAGSTAAYHLAESGSLDVLVVDRSSFPRHKACGGALVGSRDWPDLFPNYAGIRDQLHCHSIERVQFRIDRSPWWEGRDAHFFDQVRRDELDDLLLQAALARPGVSFRVFHVRSVERRRDGMIELSDGSSSLVARVVIGADGASSRVARAVGNPKRSANQRGTCLIHHIACERPHDDAVIFYLWGGDPGYCYLFPTTDGYCAGAGFLGEAGKRTRAHLDALVSHCAEQGLLPEQHEIRRTLAGLAPAVVTDRVADENILLVGDAAGLLDQLSGEGIYHAMRSGQIAASALAEGLEGCASRYGKAIQPVVDDVTYLRTIRPRLLQGILQGYFGVTALGHLVGLDGPLKSPFINRLFRRTNLSPGSRYETLD